LHEVHEFFLTERNWFVYSMVLNLFCPTDHLFKKYSMDHFSMLTSHEQLVNNVLNMVTIFRNVLSINYETLWDH